MWGNETKRLSCEKLHVHVQQQHKMMLLQDASKDKQEKVSRAK